MVPSWARRAAFTFGWSGVLQGMGGKPSIPVRDGQIVSVECDPVLCFTETNLPELRPRLLVDRLLYARALLQANPVLAPRFRLGDCAPAHHIVLGSAMTGVAAADRVMAFGFRVEPSIDPPGIRFVLSSSHSETEIRALLVAITIAVRDRGLAGARLGACSPLLQRDSDRLVVIDLEAIALVDLVELHALGHVDRELVPVIASQRQPVLRGVDLLDRRRGADLLGHGRHRCLRGWLIRPGGRRDEPTRARERER